MIRAALALIGCALTLGCASSSRLDYFNNRECDFYGSSFCTAIGGDVYISNGPDFFVYNFYVADVNVLAIYEGDHAQVFGPERFGSKQVGATVVKYREYDDGETLHRYFLNEYIDRPQSLHMMSPSTLTDGQRAFVERALSTLRYCRPQGASMICR